MNADSVYKITEAYKTPYENPIVLNINDIVILGKKDEKWDGWIWAENKTHKGWIPIQIVNILEENKGRILEFYSAKELNVNVGDFIKKIKTLNGWTWVKNIQTLEEGWIPNEIIEQSR
ncbi:MAG: SH3 domain-containing protein [Petrimonas sp.]|jgi:hypothetical protein|nr:MAG: Variant SH3 domain protein [Bacteroidetes bacterium ADurb.BinA174]